ncbi:hypothetical protein GCM10025791_45500 [Halioxenophilus aromaticivorans]|uniref:Uncharacterized protein n=1 Tax=Halioxenophilus aromaticivorans TaxID=1306992 RepID=A0AAV3U8M5_9ALTE
MNMEGIERCLDEKLLQSLFAYPMVFMPFANYSFKEPLWPGVSQIYPSLMVVFILAAYPSHDVFGFQ